VNGPTEVEAVHSVAGRKLVQGGKSSVGCRDYVFRRSRGRIPDPQERWPYLSEECHSTGIGAPVPAQAFGQLSPHKGRLHRQGVGGATAGTICLYPF
jgi:hypothetical protein